MTTTHMITWHDGPETPTKMAVRPTADAAYELAAELRAKGAVLVDVWANVTEA